MRFCGFCGMGSERLQPPFAVPFLWNDPYGMKSGFAEKQFFRLRKIVFFRTCLDCFAGPTIDRERQTKADQENHIPADPRGCAKQTRSGIRARDLAASCIPPRWKGCKIQQQHFHFEDVSMAFQFAFYHLLDRG